MMMPWMLSWVTPSHFFLLQMVEATGGRLRGYREMPPVDGKTDDEFLEGLLSPRSWNSLNSAGPLNQWEGTCALAAFARTIARLSVWLRIAAAHEGSDRGAAHWRSNIDNLLRLEEESITIE